MALRFRLLQIPMRLISQASSSELASAPQPEGESSLEKQEPRDDDLYRYLWIKCQGHELAVLDSYETFVKTAANHLDIQYERTDIPWRTIKRKTLLASRFVHKKYRVQYETRSYYRNLLFKNLTGSTVDTFLEYVERNLPEGILMIAEKHRLGELPFDLEKNIDSELKN